MNENDKELLELAAKAAGMGLADYQDTDPETRNGLWMARGYANPQTGSRDWNPLTDDGDALRLMVRLGIEPRGPSRSRSVGRVVQAWYPPDGNPNRSACAHVTVPTNGDRYAATRRAIVRAAVEIGKAMP